MARRCTVDGCDKPRVRDSWFCIDHMAQTFAANPNAGKVACPECSSSEWTMPFGDLAPGKWRCVSCHVTFLPAAQAAAAPPEPARLSQHEQPSPRAKRPAPRQQARARARPSQSTRDVIGAVGDPWAGTVRQRWGIGQ